MASTPTPPPNMTPAQTAAWQAAVALIPASPTPATTTPPASTPPAPQTNAQGVIVGAAPTGSTQSSNGNYVAPNGQQYTLAPGATAPGTGSGGVVTPPTEEDTFTKYYNQASGLIDSIQAAYDNSVAEAETAGSEQEAGQAAADAAAGLMGSSAAAANAGNIQNLTTQQIATINTQRASSIAGIVNDLQSAAQTQANTDYTNAEEANQAALKNAQTALSGLITNGVSLQTLSTNPAFASTYQTLLQSYGNDPNALSAAYTLSTPAANVLQSWSVGNTYQQLVQDPVTKAVSVQSFDLPVPVPQGGTTTKIGTNGSQTVYPDGSVLYLTIDPLGTGVVPAATGAPGSTAQTYAAQLNAANGASGTGGASSSTPASTAGAGGTGYITAATSTAGISDPTELFSTAVNGDGTATNPGVGIAALVGGIIEAEGGSEPDVVNNPGNVKYVAGMAGATDSGVKAPDGGTYANFDTVADGQAAISNSLSSIANNLGANATVQDVLNKYANLGSTASSPASGGNILTSPATVSALATYGAAPFDPGTPGASNQTQSQLIDQGAYNYLQTLLTTGNAPASTGGMGGIPAKLYQSDVQTRAEQLYGAAVGSPIPTLPNAVELASNLSLLTGNNAYLNTLGINAPTIATNASLLEGKIDAGNINQNAPAINAVIDPIITALGNVPVASYNAQVSTLGNELGSLLALKNATGTTVHDKLVSAGIVSSDASAAQIASAVNTVLQEASNATAAINTSNLNLYIQTDPFMSNQLNPLNQTTTFTDANGENPISFDPHSLTPQEAQTLLSSGYQLQSTNASGGND